MHPRLLALVVSGLLGACSASPPADPQPPPPAPLPPPPAASSVALPPSPPASSPPAASAAAPEPAPPARPSSCEGAAVDLDAALADKGCLAPLADEPPPASTVKVTVSPSQPSIKSGEWLTLDVTLENTGGAPVELRFAAVSRGPGFGGAFGSIGSGALDGALGGAFGGPAGRQGLGSSRGHLGGGKAKKKASPRPGAPPPEPAPEATPTASVGAADAKGRDVDSIPGTGGIGMIGLKPREEVKVTLAPGGKLTARAHWLARGYDPTKSYIPKNADPREGFMMPPKEPLRPGSYTLTVDVGARGKGAPVGKVSVKVE